MMKSPGTKAGTPFRRAPEQHHDLEDAPVRVVAERDQTEIVETQDRREIVLCPRLLPQFLQPDATVGANTPSKAGLGDVLVGIRTSRRSWSGSACWCLGSGGTLAGWISR